MTARSSTRRRTPDRARQDADASGLVVMPGGVDMHCHIAGPKVNAAARCGPRTKRKAEKVVRTANTRSGTMGSVPSTFATGYKYAGLGYTTAFDAAIPPLAARHAHEEFEDTPASTRGSSSSWATTTSSCSRSSATSRSACGRSSPGCWARPRVHAEARQPRRRRGLEAAAERQRPRPGRERRALRRHAAADHRAVARAVDELRLPHPVHIHCNNLGMPGNWTTTLETMKALEGDSRPHHAHPVPQLRRRRRRREHVQQQGRRARRVRQRHPNLTVDVGQVLFGETTTMTGDGPLGYYLSNAFKSKWFSSDTEMEAGCGIAPIEYKNKSLVHSLQWAIGLEWYLLAKDPWRVVMSTDHPNGGSFLAYPQIIQLLMDRTYRQDMLKRVHPAVLERSTLADLTREYTLVRDLHHHAERSGPILGLENKGHLGPGADADITIYTPNDDKTKMFELPRSVIKSGVVIVEQGEIREPLTGKLLYVAPDTTGIETDIAEWFEKYYSIRFRNYPVSLDYLHDREEVACATDLRRTRATMLTLRYKADTSIPVEVEGLTPSAVRGDDAGGDRAVRDLPRQPEGSAGGVLRGQRRSGRCADRVRGQPGRRPLDRRTDVGRRDHVRGDAGRHVGSEMTGGLIHVHGNASDWVGGEMHGGLIHVHGNAGHLIGSAYRGARSA